MREKTFQYKFPPRYKGCTFVGSIGLTNTLTNTVLFKIIRHSTVLSILSSRCPCHGHQSAADAIVRVDDSKRGFPLVSHQHPPIALVSRTACVLRSKVASKREKVGCYPVNVTSLFTTAQLIRCSVSLKLGCEFIIWRSTLGIVF
jgi:hypothetical protein